MNKNYLVAAFAAVSLFGTGVAQAEMVSKKVSYAGLDLASDAGRGELDRRIKTAANEICGGHNFSDYASRKEAQRCRREAIASAQGGVGLAVAQYEQRKGVQLASSR